jgi:hypothetical protein
MPQQPADEEPKLIIDEDWKTQVQREKEELKRKQSQPGESDQTADPAEVPSSEKEDKPKAASQPLPPATFEVLVSSLATQALAAMGLLPDESDQPLPRNMDYARHNIDLLAMLETKTSGHLTDQEQQMLKEALHQLRMLFVSIQNSG